jgi:hypothetical protein
VINVIFDNSVMGEFAERSTRVEARHVLDVCRDLRLLKPDQQSAPAEPATVMLAEVAAQFEPAVSDSPMKTLERYSVAAGHRSPLARLTDKLGLTRRIETA